MKDLIWGTLLKILKRWTRANILTSVHKQLDELRQNDHILSIGGYGSVDNFLRSNLNDKKVTFQTFDIDESHKPDLLGDVQALSKTIRHGYRSPNLIIALEVFEHVPDVKKAIHECFKVLEKDGILIFSTPWITPIHDRPHDYWRITPQAINFMTSDFKNVQILARGNQFDSIVALILRGLFSNKIGLKILLVAIAPLTLILRKPKIYESIDKIDSTIGYTVICRK
jgi:hypothetical protein